jgi:hypothetical protein
MNDEFEDRPDAFRALLETSTPAEAFKWLEIIRPIQENIQGIRERHEQETFPINERQPSRPGARSMGS